MLNNSQKYGIRQFLDHYKNKNSNFNIKLLNWFKSFSFRSSSDIGQYSFELDEEDLKYLFEKYSKVYADDDKMREEKRIQNLKKQKGQIEKELKEEFEKLTQF